LHRLFLELGLGWSERAILCEVCSEDHDEDYMMQITNSPRMGVCGYDTEVITLRRTDREVSEKGEILDILGKCQVMHLGIYSPDYPYVVPMNFGFDYNGHTLTLWFHCAKEGTKLDLISQNSMVGFEADCSHKLIIGEKACNFTMEYESVMGSGTITICSEIEDKHKGLMAIMRQYVPDGQYEISDDELSSLCVLRLDVASITGKRLKTA